MIDATAAEAAAEYVAFVKFSVDGVFFRDEYYEPYALAPNQRQDIDVYNASELLATATATLGMAIKARPFTGPPTGPFDAGNALEITIHIIDDT